jgi:hypothetical protein
MPDHADVLGAKPERGCDVAARLLGIEGHKQHRPLILRQFLRTPPDLRAAAWVRPGGAYRHQDFKRLSGYDTLRMVLSKEVILVEGPSDDLVVQRAFRDARRVPPLEVGVDIISVRGLAFKRFLDIAVGLRIQPEQLLQDARASDCGRQ